MRKRNESDHRQIGFLWAKSLAFVRFLGPHMIFQGLDKAQAIGGQRRAFVPLKTAEGEVV